MKNLIDIGDISLAEEQELIDLAKDIIQNPEDYKEACHRKKLATLFFEPSTRTRLSFEAAKLFHGGLQFRVQGRKRIGYREDGGMLCGHNRHAPPKGRRSACSRKKYWHSAD
jgi:ornithine carbamoyltransferase